MYVCQKNAFSSEEVVQSYALFWKNLHQFVPKTFIYVSCRPKMPVFCVKNVKTEDVPSGKGGRAGGVKKLQEIPAEQIARQGFIFFRTRVTPDG